MTLSTKNPKVLIVLVNYCGWADTIECLESLLRLEYDNYQIAVVDNASNDGSVEKIKLWAGGKLEIISNLAFSLRNLSFPPISKPIEFAEYNRKQAEDIDLQENAGLSSDKSLPLIIINSGENLGFAGGNNVGLRYALNDDNLRYVWLLNNDTVAEPTALIKMLNRMKEKPSAGMCGSTLRYYYNPGTVQTFGGGQYNRWLGWNRFLVDFDRDISALDPEDIESRLDNISGASMLVSRSFLETVGLMSEDYFLFFEELDWAARAGDKFTLAFARESVVYHKNGMSIKKSDSPYKFRLFSEYHVQKNKIVFTRKFYSYALPSVYFGLILAAAMSVFKRQWKRAILILKIMFGISVDIRY
ncbi:MAG: glycosyltransferase family 2 protein [Candidatus Zixiibacteriota bacterium]|nr:MAG: glycosyltransferase family 2 protein [candidate division Zixibacteria bacterium]